MVVGLTDLIDIVHKALLKYGYSSNEAEIIGNVLIYAQMRGNNQGIVKLIGRGLPKDPRAGEITVIKETKLSALLDGNHQMGMIVMDKAMKIVLEKAHEYGFAMVGTNNTESSTGAIGYYARKLAEKNLIGLVFAGSPETVNTHGSYEALFGTNPLAVGVPSEGDPVVLDMATAAMAYYGLIEAKTAGRTIPDNTAYDKDGNVTTDPAKAMDGAIMPFDRSYKGAGLSMMVEVLTGPLVGAMFVGLGSNGWGNLIIAISPDLLRDVAEFKKEVKDMVEKIHSAKCLPRVESIFVPGEKGDLHTKEVTVAGCLEIEDNLYRSLLEFVGE